MSKEIKFSIVIPSYGVANYISEALGNLMHQTYDNFEVIIVDDCSPDRTGEIAQNFVQRDDRFTYLRHDVNQGVSAARNTGIAHANGDYILFLDPDDTYEVHMLSVLAKTLQRNPVDLIIYGHTEDYRDKDTGKVEYSRTFNLAGLGFEDDAFTTNDEVTIHKMAMDLEHATMLGYPWNKAYKVSIIRDYNLEYRRIRHVEDILFNCDFLDHVKSMTILSDVCYHYRNQGQARLTAGDVNDYMELQKTRIGRLFEQQQTWKTCDFDALGILSAEYFRSFQSNIVRMLEQQNTEAEILQWCQAEATSDLFAELYRHLPKGSKTITLLYQPIAEQNFLKALHRAKLMEYTKSHFPGVFNRAKQMR